MTIPTMEQRVRILIHAGWDMRDDGLPNDQIVEQLRSEGVPDDIATSVPNLIDEALKESSHDSATRHQCVEAVTSAVHAEDFDSVQDALSKTLDDERTLHKAYQELCELLVGESHEQGTVAAYGLSLLVGIGDWPLIQALDHEDENLRYRAAFALGKMGADAKNALTTLEERMSDPDEYVRDAVSQAISRIKSATKPWWKFW